MGIEKDRQIEIDFNGEPIVLREERYAQNGALAVEVKAGPGHSDCFPDEPYATLSVNLDLSERLPKDVFYCKGPRSENEPLFNRLVELGVIRPANYIAPMRSGYMLYWAYKIDWDWKPMEPESPAGPVETITAEVAFVTGITCAMCGEETEHRSGPAAEEPSRNLELEDGALYFSCPECRLRYPLTYVDPWGKEQLRRIKEGSEG